LAFTTVFAVLIDLGLTNVFIREGAKKETAVQSLLSQVLGLKCLLAIVTYLIIFVFARLLHYDAETQLLIAISGITVIFDSFQTTMYGALRVFGRLGFEAVGLVLAQSMTLLGGGIFLYAHLPIAYLMIAFLCTSILHVFYVAVVAWVVYRLRMVPVWQRTQVYPLIKTAIPFAMAAIFFRIFTATDSLIVFSLLGAQPAGWYSIPTKIISAFQFIPLSLVAAIYPRLSEWSVTNPERQSDAFVNSFEYLLLIVLPISAGIIVLSPTIIKYFFSVKYLPAIVPLQILMISMIFAFLMYPIGACLNAIGKQSAHTFFVGSITILNIAITWTFVNMFDIVGAAVGSLVSTAMLTCVEYWYLGRLIQIPQKSIFIFAAKVVLSVVVMGVAVWNIANHAWWIYSVPIGAVLYGGLLWVLRVVTPTQILHSYSKIKM
jgi:O-antigen/teichoic acid export membrane protein